MNTLGVSVCIFSYNYEKYISQAIESVINQKTDFQIEIVIGDDKSTDKTREIVQIYKNKYPDLIQLSFNEKNIGGTQNWINTISQCNGKYIALLDGDDYFTDVQKLQKQYDILENNKEAVLCFHAVEEKYENIDGKDTIVRFEDKKYTIEDFLANGWFIRTSSTFFKNNLISNQEIPKWVYNFPYRFDTILHVFLTRFGYALYIDEPLSVWRRHFNGMSRIINSNTIKSLEIEIELANELDKYTAYQYSNIIKKYSSIRYSTLIIELLRSGLFIRKLKLLFISLKKINLFYIFNKIKLKLEKNKSSAMG